MAVSQRPSGKDTRDAYRAPDVSLPRIWALACELGRIEVSSEPELNEGN
jgi:hypothetical protein